MAAQGQLKVVDLGTNRKRSYGFLLVFNSNHGRILHHFGDMAPSRSKNRPFKPIPLSQIVLARGDLLIIPKANIMISSPSESLNILVSRNIWFVMKFTPNEGDF